MRDPETPEASPPEAHSTALNLVAFDFDGTLTVRDTFMAFLFWRTRGLRRALVLIRLAPAALAYLSHRDRGRIKAAAVKAFLGGVEQSALSKDAERFAAERFEALLRPDALATWKQHQANGDQVIIVTASPSLVIAPFAERLGAARLIGTRLRLDTDSRITGEFYGANCRGEEKVRRITEVFGAVRLKAAYGDTAGDIEMLAMADQPSMRLFKGRPAHAQITKSAIDSRP